MDIFDALNSRKKGAVLKHTHFFQLYNSQFAALQDEKVKILEIGVYNGGSLFMWRKFFPNAEVIVGIDIDQYCKRWEDKEENIFIEIGDQVNKDFLLSINEKYGPFDIIIDDGGHENNQIITSFQTLFPLLKNEGYYVVEDTYHSYWPDYSCDRDNSTKVSTSFGVKGGKPTNIDKTKSDITSMDFLKSLADKLNVAAYIENGEESQEAGYNMVYRNPDEYEKNLFSITFYDNICFMQKYTRGGLASFGKATWYEHVVPIPDDKNYE